MNGNDLKGALKKVRVRTATRLSILTMSARRLPDCK